MAVTLSIKQVPDAVAEALRQRAARNHRSLQRELLALVEAAVTQAPPGAAAAFAPPVGALALREPETRWYAKSAEGDALLAELDAVVAGSRFGHAPLLTREQANDRALARELDFDSREAELAPSARRP